MNMRQQRITTSQQEVYLIYLMEHTEFAASRIKDGDCCCSFFSFSSFGSHLYIFFENYVLLFYHLVLLFPTLNSQVNLNTTTIGRSWRRCWTIRWVRRRRWTSGKWYGTANQQSFRSAHNKLPNCSHKLWMISSCSFLALTQVFFNWKNQLRTRAKKLKQIQDGKTGADDKLALQKLTDVEKRALKLWKEDFQDKDIASVSENVCR